jgi:excinuclease ABC subunit A
MEKPDVDSIEGLSPAISIEQKTAGHNPRSTVGTVTEIHDYLRLLFARIGTPTCWKCGRVISGQTVQEIADQTMALESRRKVPGTRTRGVGTRKGQYRELFDKLKKDGYVRARVDGTVYALEEEIKLDKNKKHSVEVVVDRLVAGSGITAAAHGIARNRA